jgi:hypothetical protein
MSDEPALFQNLISQSLFNQLCSEEVNIHLLNKPLSITTLFRPTDSFKSKRTSLYAIQIVPHNEHNVFSQEGTISEIFIEK